jgi:hypothetical protein
MTKQTPETIDEERLAARFAAEVTALQRHYCTVFKFWRTCPLKLCRKVRACSGDAKDCLKRRIAEVSREVQWDARQHILAATRADAGPERAAREFLPGALAEG